jgi:hypothetical protein
MDGLEVISRQFRFIFVHIPKTGGNSVLRALLPYTESPLDETALSVVRSA